MWRNSRDESSGVYKECSGLWAFVQTKCQISASCVDVQTDILLRKGPSLHKIPFYGDDRPEAKRRRKKWVDFVSRKRDKWRPTTHSVICSVHFNASDYEKKYLVEIPNAKNGRPSLKRDDFGISVFPSIQCKSAANVTASARSARQVSNNENYMNLIFTTWSKLSFTFFRKFYLSNIFLTL